MRRAGSRSSGSRSRARASSTTWPRRCPRSSLRARCSSAPRRSASSIRMSTGALADLEDELGESAAPSWTDRPERQADESGRPPLRRVNVARRLERRSRARAAARVRAVRRARRGSGAAGRRRRRALDASSSWPTRTDTSTWPRSANSVGALASPTSTARQILDSRGNPTVEVDVRLEDGLVRPRRRPLRRVDRPVRGSRAAGRRRRVARQGRARGGRERPARARRGAARAGRRATSASWTSG